MARSSTQRDEIFGVHRQGVERRSRFVHSYGIVAGTFRFWKWWALPCAFSASHRLRKPAFLPSVPNWAVYQHRMLLPLQFPRCQHKNVNIREEDSLEFTVDVMQDEKVIAVMPMSRSFWFAGEDHVQTSFSFGDILLSQLSVPYIC